MGDENKYETKQFLDIIGLESFWEKAKAYIDGADENITNQYQIASNDDIDEIFGSKV